MIDSYYIRIVKGVQLRDPELIYGWWRQGGSVDSFLDNLNLIQKLKRHTVAPRGSWTHTENDQQRAVVALEILELAKAP